MLPVYKYMFICVQHTIMLRNKSRVFNFNREIMSLQFCVHVLASRPATLAIVRTSEEELHIVHHIIILFSWLSGLHLVSLRQINNIIC
jgi:hypothetical protein